MKKAIDFKEQLLQNQQMIELVCMKNKVSRMTATKMIDMFVLEQEAIKTKYDNLSDCIKHFINWSNGNASKMGNGSSSQSKILGL